MSSDERVTMTRGRSTIAVPKSRVDFYTAQGWAADEPKAKKAPAKKATAKKASTDTDD